MVVIRLHCDQEVQARIAFINYLEIHMLKEGAHFWLPSQHPTHKVNLLGVDVGERSDTSILAHLEELRKD